MEAPLAFSENIFTLWLLTKAIFDHVFICQNNESFNLAI